MQVNLAFGRTGLPVTLPAGPAYHVLEARSAVALPDARQAIADALDSPIGTAPLRALAAGKRSAAISVCDITRPAPNKLVLPLVLERLHAAGIPREGISFCIATGLHRGATPEELNEILGADLVAQYRIVNHDARDFAAHEHLGETKSGTPVYIDRTFLAADLHITLGFIEPHLMLGFSGGRKLIAPGLAAQETIKVIHSPKFMRDARAVEGSVADNPLHRELLEIARMARHDFVVDVALTRHREIAGVFAGDSEKAHAKGMSFVSQALLDRLEQPVDAVITSAAGHPLDLTFYQAIKGVTAASHIVKPGGRILIVAACSEGAGAPEFCEMIGACGSSREFLERLAASPVIVDQWQLEKLALVMEKLDVQFYVPGLPEQYQKSLWGRSFSDIDDALRSIVAGLKPGAEVAVLPEGPYVLARVGPEGVTVPA